MGLKKLENSVFYISEESKDIHYQCIKHEIFDLQVYDLPFCPLPSRGVILDLGANIGMFAQYAISRKNNFMYCFEPALNCLPALHKNLEPYTGKYSIIEKGVWSSSKTVNFFEYNDFSGCNQITNSDNNDTHKIETVSIDKFVDQNKINKIDFMKFDIEGAEKEALIGAKETIQKFKPRMVVSIYHKPEDEVELVDYVKSLSDYKITIVNHTDIEIKLAYCF